MKQIILNPKEIDNRKARKKEEEKLLKDYLDNGGEIKKYPPEVKPRIVSFAFCNYSNQSKAKDYSAIDIVLIDLF